MSEKVLLVDDEEDFRQIMTERMTARGIEVTTASSAQEALAKIEKESFDAVILDFMMPEMDGVQALKNLRAKQPELQIILLTGHATVEKGVEAMKLGAMDFLEKPADINALVEKIKAAQGKKTLLVEKKSEERIKSILGGKGW